MKFNRYAALMIFLLPLILSIYGVKWMRDALFAAFSPQPFEWGLFLLGLLSFVAGISFIGGFIYYRDHKHKYKPKFKDDL